MDDLISRIESDLSTLRELCRQYVEGVCENGYDSVDEDLPHYIFEAAVQAFYGPKVFETLNRLGETTS